ncbi:ABC transporter ATP-binding protein [Candidatus Caldarchaeum subterraneum]|uniref:ABC transporter ATP-binding protein n=1 Tax=Caldiarchaeum subterraneum TaxID=311458 RepID=E6N5V9_CALS0|nr:ABC transporter ATP-binding protein [Candidatus Caldarchaeum subterraneum]BAJ50468.1 ABC transporter ATP-binding protein [Candidatus Caldarchaeum subterraneum]
MGGVAVFRVPVVFADYGGKRGFGFAGLRTRVTRVFGGVVKRSRRVGEVASLMGLGLEDVVMPVFLEAVVEVEKGDVVYVTGESGGGKSLLLRHLAEEMSRLEEFAPVACSWKIMDNIPRRRPLIDCVGRDVKEAVEILSAAGLSDVYTWFRCFDELSDGQRMRFIFAKALDAGAKTVVLDEFCSALDRETAKATAYTMQKLARRRGITFIAATAVDDLGEDLNPSLLIVKHMGPHLVVKRLNPVPRPCSLLEKVVVEEGSVEDWRLLSFLHYRSHRVAAAVKIFRAVLNGRVVGVVVYAKPYLQAAGFAQFFSHDWYRRERMNHVLRIQRVVVHPSFRGIGVARKLLQESMPRLGVPFVEILSAMEKLIPFTRGIMTRWTVVEPNREKRALLEEFSQRFGIDVMKHGVVDVLLYAEKRGLLRGMRSWLIANRHRYGDTSLKQRDAAKLLRTLKSSCAAKVYGLWINPEKKFRKIVEEAMSAPRVL